MRIWALVLGVILPTTALADGDSWVTLGVGTVVSTSASTPAADSTSGELRLKLRALKLLGLELAYQGANGKHDEAAAASFYLHLVPTTPLGAYLKAGVAAASFDGLAKRAWLDYGYHAGLGLEVHCSEHIVVVGEGALVLPVATLSKLQGPEGMGAARAALGYRASLGLMLFL